MLIRNAVEEDATGIAQVQINSYRTAYAGLLPADYLAAFSLKKQGQEWKELLRAGEELALVAVNESGMIIGYALAKKLAPGEASFDCELKSLHVNRAEHLHGVGRALIREIAQRMRILGCKSLGLYSLEGLPACQFYEHLGGKIDGERMFEIDEFHLHHREIGYRWEKIEDLI